MRKLRMLILGVLTIVLVTGCAAGGAGVEVGYLDSTHYSV